MKAFESCFPHFHDRKIHFLRLLIYTADDIFSTVAIVLVMLHRLFHFALDWQGDKSSFLRDTLDISII